MSEQTGIHHQLCDQARKLMIPGSIEQTCED